MVKGSVPVTWQPDDYLNLDWFNYEDIPYRFTSRVKDLGVYNVGVASCSEGLPDSLMRVADNFSHINNVVTAVNRMTPGQTLPFHSDNYSSYRKNFGIDDEVNIIRIIVFLHDPAPGQQLWVEDEFCAGICGSYFSWENKAAHMAANLSTQDRYVLQITGTSKWIKNTSQQ